MVNIVEAPTKKALKELLERQGGDIFIIDPSIVNPRTFRATEIPVGQSEVVTNHPKRSYFAKIKMTKKGLRVE